MTDQTLRSSELITAAREAKGLTQHELAEQAGITVQALKHYEWGKREILRNKTATAAVCRVLEMDPGALFREALGFDPAEDGHDLTSSEMDLVRNFRAIDEAHQRTVSNMARELAGGGT